MSQLLAYADDLAFVFTRAGKGARMLYQLATTLKKYELAIGWNKCGYITKTTEIAKSFKSSLGFLCNYNIPCCNKTGYKYLGILMTWIDKASK